MRRTQLYLEDDLWKALHQQARREKSTVSDLVRRAVRERYMTNREHRREAMKSWVGIWKDRNAISDVDQYIRGLREDDRLERLQDNEG